MGRVSRRPCSIHALIRCVHRINHTIQPIVVGIWKKEFKLWNDFCIIVNVVIDAKSSLVHRDREFR